jgi:dihydrofolate reductase
MSIAVMHSSLLLIRGGTKQAKRYLAVKALSWCAPSSHSSSKPKNSTTTADDINNDQPLIPIQQFGIVAAMSTNRIIGINGKLPWRLPKDRKSFKALTENKILIIGRNTFEENPLRRHIDHAAASVVISRSLDKRIFETDDSLKIARSFPEALHIARLLVHERNLIVDTNSGNNDATDLACWVAGGTRVYNEALLHPSAHKLHLTTVDNEIHVLPDQQFAQFPPFYRWDNKFKAISKVESFDGGLKITQQVFQRLKGLR